MRINDDYVLRTVAGEALLINEGAVGVNLNGLLSLNGAAAWLWNKAAGSGADFDEAMLSAWLMEEYDVEEEKARRDVAGMVRTWRKYGVVID